MLGHGDMMFIGPGKKIIPERVHALMWMTMRSIESVMLGVSVASLTILIYLTVILF